MTDRDYRYCWIIDRALMVAAVVMLFLLIEQSIAVMELHVEQEIKIAALGAMPR